MRFLRILFVLVSILILLAIALSHTDFVKRRIAQYLQTYALQQYNLHGQIGLLDYDIFPLIVRAKNIRIFGGERNEQVFLAAKSAELELSYSIFWSDRFHLKRISVEAPELHYENLPPLRKSGKGEASFQIDDLEIKDGTVGYQTYRFGNVNLRASADSNRIEFREVKGSYKNAEIRLRGDLKDFDRPKYQVAYDISGDANLVSENVLQLPKLSGKVHTAGTLSGESTAYTVAGFLEADHLQQARGAPFYLGGKYKIRSSGSEPPCILDLTWQSMPASLLNGFITGLPPLATQTSGNFRYEGGFDLWKGEGTFWMNLDRTSEKTQGVEGTLNGSIRDGRVIVEGSTIAVGESDTNFIAILTRNTLDLKLDGRVASARDLKIFLPKLTSIPGSYRFALRMSGPYRNLRVDGTVIGKAKDFSVQASGVYDLATEIVDADFRGEFNGRAFHPDLSGKGAIQGELSGSVSRPIVKADLEARNLTARQVPVGDLSARLESDGRVLKANAIVPELSGNFDGSYVFASKDFQLDGFVKDVDASQFKSFFPASMHELSGKISANVSVSGNAARWKNSSGLVTIQEAAFQREGIQLEIDEGSFLKLNRQIVDVSMQAKAQEGFASITGKIALKSPHAVNLNVSGQADLGILWLFTNELEGRGNVDFQASVRGTIRRPLYSGELSLPDYDLTWPSQSLKLQAARSTATLTSEKVVVEGKGTLNGASAEWRGTVPFSSIPGEIHLAIQSFSPATIFRSAGIAGTVSLTLDARGKGESLRNWKGLTYVTANDLSLGDTRMEAGRPVELLLKDGVVELSPVRVRVGELLDLTAAGKLHLEKRMVQAQIETSAELSLISRFVPEWKAAGRAIAKAELNGTLEAPEFSGIVTLDQGMMRMEGYPFLLEKIRFVAPLEKDRIRIESFSASMGGGSLQGMGEIRLRGNDPDRIRLQVNARNVATNYPEDLRSLLNADLSFTGEAKSYMLSGKVNLLRSAFRQDIDPRSRLIRTLLSQRKALIPQHEAFSSKVRLQLEMETARDVLVENNLTRLRAGARLQITGTLDQPRLSGRMEVREGSELYFEGNTYSFEEGSVNFLGARKFNPELRVRLLTLVQDPEDQGECEIRLQLFGPLEDFEVTPTSSCVSLTEDFQIYSMLLTGTTQASRAPNIFFARQLASYLTGTLLFDFQQKIAKGLGLETFALEPLIIATESDPGARLTLGKRLSPQLKLVYSLSLSESTDQTWIATYRVANNLGLRFIDQTDDSYTTSLRHRFRFGKGGVRRSDFLAAELQTEKTFISSVALENDSNLAEGSIRKTLDISPEDRYDFWKIQDKIERLKQKLQKEGYLFPQVEVDEKILSETAVGLTLRISGQGYRKFLISGIKIPAKQDAKYQLWWREEFSEAAVLQRMENDILESLRSGGYFQATVTRTMEETGQQVVYRFHVEPGRISKESNLKFQGSMSIPFPELEKRLRSFYPSREAMITDALYHFANLAEKITALYVEQGFLQSVIKPGRVIFDDRAQSVTREVQIEAGPQSRIAKLDVKGDEFPDDLLKSLKLQEGSVYRPLLVADDEIAVEEFYEERGHWKIDVAAVAEKIGSGSDVVLRYDLETGGVARIGNIRVQGNRNTRESVILRKLALKTGETINHAQLAQAQGRLYDLGLFERVNIRIENTELPGIYDVIVDLVEFKHYEISYGGRYDSEKEWEGDFELSNLNLFGTAQSLSLYGRFNTRERLYKLLYNSPSIFGWDWNAFFIAERTDRTDLDILQTNLAFQQFYRLWKPFLLQTGYTFKRASTRLFNPIDNVFEKFILDISALQTTLLADTRDNPIDATRGSFFSAGMEYAPSSLGSSAVFLKTYTQFFHYRRISRLIWASAVRLGLATTLEQETLVRSERFFAGGSDTLRGFRFNEVGPRNPFLDEPFGGEAVFILNEELRFPIYKWFRGVVFYDGGNVYLEVPDFSLGDFRHTAGFGVRLALPYGLVGRLDLGFNLKPENEEPRSVFHFSLGQAF